MASMDKPVLNGIQRAWLQEIGLDARMLAHFGVKPSARAAEPAAEAPQVKQATPGATLVADLLKRTPLPQAADAGEANVATDCSAAAAVSDAQHADLNQLRGLAEQCQACGLHEVRGRVVFGEGLESAPQWMFVGEAPGEYDDSVGRPFQGRAGELLRSMLKSIGIMDDGPAYFTNVLKCRPMGNRSPQAAEVAACMPLLRRQIQLLRPACLVALGRVSASALLGRDDDLDQLRGKVHHYVDEEGRSIPLVVTYHPASLLLHGQLKAEAWRDLNLLADLHA